MRYNRCRYNQVLRLFIHFGIRFRCVCSVSVDMGYGSELRVANASDNNYN